MYHDDDEDQDDETAGVDAEAAVGDVDEADLDEQQEDELEDDLDDVTEPEDDDDDQDEVLLDVVNCATYTVKDADGPYPIWECDDCGHNQMPGQFTHCDGCGLELVEIEDL